LSSIHSVEPTSSSLTHVPSSIHSSSSPITMLSLLSINSTQDAALLASLTSSLSILSLSMFCPLILTHLITLAFFLKSLSITNLKS
jgi:hypothetical protein